MIRAPMRVARLLPLATALLLAGCRTPRGTAERPAVTAFEIQGTHALDPDDIREKLATQPSEPWWHLFFRDASYFDEDAFANDRKRVERLYQSEGHYQAKVVDAQVLPDGDGRVKLRMRVEEGPPAKVVELRIDGLDDAPEARGQLRELPLREGQRFTEAGFDATRAAIEDALGRTGYAKAEVTQRAHVDPQAGEVRVVYTVIPGTRYRFGNVFVSGTAAIPRARVRQEAEIVLEPNQWFDRTDLQQIQSRVFDLGVFGGVRVTPGPADEKKALIPIIIAAREAPFRTIRAGPGLGVELTRWDANVTVGWAHRNWLGGLRKLSLDARVGYAWLPNVFSRQETGFVGLVSADFTQPGLIRQRIDLNARVELERGLEQGYRFWSERFRLGLPVRISRALTFVPSYNLELYQITGTIQTTVGGATNELLQSCRGESCVLSYLEQRITLDLRDDPINTRRGLYLSLALQEGFQLFGNGFPYLRFLPEARAFLPVWKKTVVAGRLRVGALRSLNAEEPPVISRFYSGGPSLMRGYYTRQLSPVVYDAGSKDYIPVGGQGLVDGSVELRVPLTGRLGAAIYLDYGIVTQERLDALDPGQLQYAAGVGLRYGTLFGPLRIDVAGRLPRRSASVQSGWVMPGVPVLAAAPDGSLVDTGFRHTEPTISVHLSLGEAF
jgi:translocation and assembly module TamA